MKYLMIFLSTLCITLAHPVYAQSRKNVIEMNFAPLATKVNERLVDKGLKIGDEVFIRIFKSEAVLELWMKPATEEEFKLFHTYPICYFSGDLGPKTKQGDKQAPEGFYAVGLNQFNPHSNYYKSFNLGYPNKYERSKGYTGNYLMVHGNCVSIGCYAMTDIQIEEIYTLAESALKQGQPFFRVHVFPFKLNESNLKRYQNNKWHGFWLMMKEGYDAFEINKIPPNIEVMNGKYIVDNSKP